MSSSDPRDEEYEDDVDDVLAAEDIAEEVSEDEDQAMDSDSDGNEPYLQNDSVAYFDLPKDSLFAVAQHPVHPSLVAVGGSAGPDDDAPGAGWVFDTAAVPPRLAVLPASYAADPAVAPPPENTRLDSLFSIDGHSDSINALCWTLPRGDVLVSGGLDGRLRVWKSEVRAGRGVHMTFVGEARETPEINWVAPCPSADNENTVALGSADGSVWVYAVDPSDADDPLRIVRSYFLHTGPCTAGAWTPDGRLLATVSEDGSLYVWDVWGQAAAEGLADDNGMTAVSLTGEDQRFAVEGGLYSVAVDPKGAFVAVGGATGAVKVVSLPRVTAAAQSQSRARGLTGTGGQILASLRAQSESVETLDIALVSDSPPTVLLAAGSVDGSIVVYDATRRFAIRRTIAGAHGEHSVVKVEFVGNSWLLTSCGMDGVVRRWDLRGGSGVAGTGQAGGPADAGLQKEWKGHRGDGEGGGVLGFVQGDAGNRVVTAGDDGISLVFDA